ncbi:MAG: type I-E CRISPR-associated protein Cse2/CasB [Acetivibrionales bacterium]|jgi:CRISPR system Cascade subunit CasB
MEERKNIVYQVKALTQKKIELLLKEGPWSRAMLAKLRRGIGKQPGELPELFEILFPDMPEELYGDGEQPSYAVWAIYTALTLFALHQQGKNYPMCDTGKAENKSTGNSLGVAVGCLVNRDRERKDAVKRRFDAVTTANEFTELSHHARGLIQLLRAEDITLDYPCFATDLYWYQFDEIRNRIRLRWGEDYYRVAQPNSEKIIGGKPNE